MNELDVLLDHPLHVVHSLVMDKWRHPAVAARALSREDVRAFMAQPCGRIYERALDRFLEACTLAGWSAVTRSVQMGVSNSGRRYPVYYLVMGWRKL